MRRLELLGERHIARTFERQATGLHIRVALQNGSTRLCTFKTQRVA